MKTTVLLLLSVMLSFSGFAQMNERYENDLRIKKAMWGGSDPDFKITKCDEKWKNESAVILCKKYEYSVQKEILVNTVFENIYNHTRILLIDKAAVDEYSTFKFDVSHNLGTYFGWRNDRSFYIGVKVVKPDGTEKEVPIDESLIDEVISKKSQKQTQKIAVPGLEPGDIIDYYYATEKSLLAQGFYAFSPVLYPLASDYPIMKQKIEMHIMRKCYLNARSLNGAPQLELLEDSKRSNMVYTITDLNRDKVKVQDQQMFYPLREVPVLMFHAYFVNNPIVKNNYCFYDKEGVIKKDVSDFELKQFLNNHVLSTNSKAIHKTVKYIRKFHKNETDPTNLAREAYYFYRQFVYAQNYKEDIARNYFKNYPPDDYDFVRSFSLILKKLDITHSVVVTVPRELGAMEDLIMPNQMGLLLCLDTPQPVYISAFSKYSLFNEVDYSYQGNNAKVMRMTGLPENRSITNAVIPQMKYAENNLTNKMEISFNPDEADKLLVAQEITAMGWNKRMYQSSLIAPEDYVKFNETEHYGVKLNTDIDPTQLQRFAQMNDAFVKKREESLNDYIKEDLNISDISVKKINILQAGIWEETPALKFTDSLEISKFITKAGDNILFEAGKLIGKQTEPDKTDTIRKFDIYMPYARSYQYEITIAIPKGYKVKGAASFNYNVTNATGGFISSAAIEGNKLVIKTSKYFTSNYFPKEKWRDMVKFLNAAIDFRNQKVMFVPENNL